MSNIISTRTTNEFIRVELLTKEQFDAEMQLGMDDIAAGRVVSASIVEEEMQKMFLYVKGCRDR